MTSSFDATAAAELFFAGAQAAGLRRVLICPGSRSSPLAIGAARQPDLDHAIHLDERTAAFAALGEAKASGEPVAVVCTSGTAGVNFGPAVAEASMSNIALIAITADRPPEHQDWGVGQSLDQRGLFGRHVRDEMTMPVGSTGGADFTERAGWRAVATSLTESGPVHVNWPFRLPLEPFGESPSGWSQLLRATRRPPTRDLDERERFTHALEQSSAPVIIAGPNTTRFGDGDSATAILSAAAGLAIPVLADILSGLRGHGELVPMPALVTATGDLRSDLVIHLGDTPTAKPLRLWWERQTEARQVFVDPDSRWHDASHVFNERYASEAAWLLTAAATESSSPTASTAHLDAWLGRGHEAERLVRETLAGTNSLTEAHIGEVIGAWAAEDERRTVVASSSMPVRDVDLFAPHGNPMSVLSNRGVNGIDGVVASAMGVERATDGRVVVLIGDVAALHDVGSILDAARHRCPLTVVIPNNNGGGIFSNLPIRQALDDALFEELFHTPHGSDFSFLGGVDNITYAAIESAEDLRSALSQRPLDDGVMVLELAVDTNERLQLTDRITEALGQL